MKILFASLLLASAAVDAQPVPPVANATDAPASTTAADDEFAEIEVTGIANPFRLTAAQLRDAVAAYGKYRPALAPMATLRFKADRDLADTNATPLRLRLVCDGGGDPVEITFDGDKVFALPPVDYRAGNCTLMANRKAGRTRVVPFIHTPGFSPIAPRQGDMRLFCEIGWAMLKHDVPLLFRAIAGMLGTCHSSKLGLFMGTGRGIARANAVWPGGSKPVTLSKSGMRYRMMIFDKSIPNDARYVIEFK